MPELPEVETVRRGLERLLVGRRLEALTISHPGSFEDAEGAWPREGLGRRVEAIERHGKLLAIHLDSGWSLAVHLKMTGQLVLVGDGEGERFGAGHPSDSLVDGLPDRSTRLEFRLDQGRLFFNDQRKFGWVRLLPRRELSRLPFVQGLGPDMLAPELSPALFGERVRRRGGSLVKAAILDQGVVAGVGNIYADEGLWEAGIHPLRRVRSLGDGELDALFAGLRRVMQASLDQGGSTSRNYVDAEGKRGAYLDFAAVFRRQGQPCRRCGTAIVKTRVAGRGSHWCPRCQVPPPGEA